MAADLVNAGALAAGGGFLMLLLAWLCGSLLLRLFGILQLITAALMLIGFAAADLLYGYSASWIIVVITAAWGAAAWILGHWIYARKYGWWKSRLAWRVLHPAAANRRTVVLR